MLGKIAVSICAVSLILNIVGLAILYWMYNSVGTCTHTPLGTFTSKAGLWKYCGDFCLDLPDVLVNSSMKAIRTLELLGMILLIGALACALLKLLVMKDNALLQKVAGAWAVLAGVFMIIGCIIFAAKYKRDFSFFSDYDLHAGFALCDVAGVGSIVSVGMFFINKED